MEPCLPSSPRDRADRAGLLRLLESLRVLLPSKPTPLLSIYQSSRFWTVSKTALKSKLSAMVAKVESVLKFLNISKITTSMKPRSTRTEEEAWSADSQDR